MKKTFALFALCLGQGLPLSAQAIDLQPEDVVAPPPNLRFVQFGYTASERGDFYANGNKLASNTEFNVSQAHVRLGAGFDWSGRPSVAYIQLPYGSIDTKNTGALDAPDRLGDTVLMLATWPIADREKHQFFGIAGYLFLPTGEYDQRYTRGGVNTQLAENRYRGSLQLGYHQRILGRLGWQVGLDTTWYGDNDEFLNSSSQRVTLSRKPLYAAQTSLAYRVQPNIGIGANYFYTAGGETKNDGVEQNNRVAVHRWQVTGFYQFTTSRVTLQYGGDIKTENGFKEDRHVIVRFTQFF
jgi:hypothetical protein